MNRYEIRKHQGSNSRPFHRDTRPSPQRYFIYDTVTGHKVHPLVFDGSIARDHGFHLKHKAQAYLDKMNAKANA